MMKLYKNKKIIYSFVFLILIVSFFLIIAGRVPTPVVMSTIPKDEEQNTLETTQISVNFNKDIREKAKERVSVKFEPQIDFDSTWLSNTYKIIPKDLLKNDSTYTVKILYKNKEINSFSFRTSIFSQKDINKFGPQQSQDDKDYGDITTKIIKKYPFYTSLPIKTKDYVVYYDFEKDQFAITLLNSEIDAEQKDLIIKDAIDKIKKIGAKDPIRYYVRS